MVNVYEMSEELRARRLRRQQRQPTTVVCGRLTGRRHLAEHRAHGGVAAAAVDYVSASAAAVAECSLLPLPSMAGTIALTA